MPLPRDEKEQSLRDQIKLWTENEWRINEKAGIIRHMEAEQSARRDKSNVLVETIGKLAFPETPTQEAEITLVDGVMVYRVKFFPENRTSGDRDKPGYIKGAWYEIEQIRATQV